ncbi:DUF4336 domain-containing protein [Sphingomonas sp. LB-2]|uniref:DUF4336 domain-containing protein n=1 Tax=Sphingomonas caeni TaxID=2984949 RepID=UPI00222E0768|nr:DUF4336 domain-containing protein [Sphingomonas caeni]MCW3849158.1 DUF4336 domain-containing protein [Sphingomonas caeni]
MAKFNTEWTVGPHGPLERLDDGLATVAGEIVMPLGRFPRRMTVVALSGNRVAIWSAIPLREPQMAEIEAMGEVAFLIVPGVAHRLDIVPWKARYPGARVLCSPGATKAVEEAALVDATCDVLEDPAVRFETPGGVGGMESALMVRREGGATLLLNDILANVRHPHGLGAQIMARLFGFGVKRPQTPWVVKRRMVKDAAALAADFRRWAAEPDLRRIIVSHGDVLSQAPRAVLERVANDLG